MKYGYGVQLIREADGETYWVARSASLKGCIGTGDTPDEAVSELEENEAAWLETALEYGIEIPPVTAEPEEGEYSGKFTVRISPFEHRRATEEAKKQGLSLNQYVGNAITNYNATISTAGHISSAVAETAQNIGKMFLSGTSYSSVTVLPAVLNPGAMMKYMQPNPVKQ